MPGPRGDRTPTGGVPSGCANHYTTTFGGRATILSPAESVTDEQSDKFVVLPWPSSNLFFLADPIRLIQEFSRVRQPLHCPETNNC